MRLQALVSALAVLPLLQACPSQPEKAAARSAEVEALWQSRIYRAELEANKPLEPRKLVAGSNEVLVLDVPTATRIGRVTRQRCYVWRDLMFQTASISCPAGDESSDSVDDWKGPAE